ncbi:MAG: hypothetical protein NZO58_11180, partial [Gemmataceae bacterium]|nr:hypothetical protein [Gemmataceae bacterium]
MTMDFFFYLLVNANLFLRPAELLPALQGVSLYYWFMLACLIVSLPQLTTLLAPDTPLRHPVSICVLGVFATVALSHLVSSEADRFVAETVTFGKVVVYFVLFVVLVNTPARLRSLLGWVVIFGATTTALSVLAFHDYLELPNRPALMELVIDPTTGQTQSVRRLMIVGILRDPNDCCVFMSLLTMLTLQRL